MPDSSPEEVAEERIAQERRAQTGTLDLRDLDLRVVPPSAFALTHLRSLTLSPPQSTKRLSLSNASKLANLTRLEELHATTTDLGDLDPVRARPELSEIWRNCRQDKAEMRQRVRVYAINNVKFRTWEERKPHAIYWKEKFDAINADVQKYGLSVLGEAGARDHRLMDYFYREVTSLRYSPIGCCR